LTPSKALIAYMTAVVRTQNGHRCQGWTDREVLESYCLCAEPGVSMEDWIEKAGIAVELGDDEISQAYKQQQNSIAEKDLPPFAEVTDG
jgi:hypothetical protein